MNYKLEKNQSWLVEPEKWEPCTNWNNIPIEKDNLEKMISCMKNNYTELSRWIWALRIIDDSGRIYYVYDPERDTRLEGCKWRIIQRNAYYLWESSDRSQSAEYYWNQAESNIEYSDGVFEVDGEYFWNSHLDQF